MKERELSCKYLDFNTRGMLIGSIVGDEHAPIISPHEV